jgi:hypothetical protein
MRLRAILAGTEGPGRRALPAGELLDPLALGAVLLLVVNDWVLKRWAPSPVTGKLSDLAGLVAAPLIATAAFDTALWVAARLGLPVDFSLRRWKLAAAVAAVGGLFAAAKLSPAVAGGLERAAAAVGLAWRITPDPGDLAALPALALAVWLARREIARLPLGRLEVLERAWRRRRTPPAAGLADVVRCGGDPAAVAALARALEDALAGGAEAPLWQALERLRRRR